MRVMVLVKANEESEAGGAPDEEMMAAMGRYNEELAKAGILLAADGLHPSSRGARIQFDGDKRTVVDGPFAETKELIAGYWLWQVKSLEEAIEWGQRCPNPTRRKPASPPGAASSSSRSRSWAESSRPSQAIAGRCRR